MREECRDFIFRFDQILVLSFNIHLSLIHFRKQNAGSIDRNSFADLLLKAQKNAMDKLQPQVRRNSTTQLLGRDAPSQRGNISTPLQQEAEGHEGQIEIEHILVLY